MQKNTKILSILVVLILIGSSIGAYFYLESQKKPEQTLTIAIDPDYTNYEYIYGAYDDIAGIDVDIMYAICQEIGYKFKFVSVPFDDIIDGVAEGAYDVGASSFTITEERRQIIDFTSHYDESGLVVVANYSKAYTKQSDLYSAKIAVQAGTVGYDFVMNTEGFQESNIIKCANSATAIAAVTNNKADCAILDEVNAESITLSSAGLRMYNVLDYKEIQFFGFVVSKDNPELLEKMNAALEKLIANGTVAKIRIYYSDSYCSKIPYYLSKR